MITASATKIHRHQCRVRAVTSSAIEIHKQSVAATCPDGNDEVGIWPSSCCTGGRGRSTAAALHRNRLSSPNIASTRNSTGRHCRHAAIAIGQNTSDTARMAWVSPALLHA
jgi:hypothetical protein